MGLRQQHTFNGNSGADKLIHLEKVAESHNFSLAECVAVGHSLSDIPIFEKVGLAIAFNGDETLEGKADIYIESDSLQAVLNHIL